MAKLIEEINAGLERWYKHCGQEDEYDNTFTEFCDENGFDNETVAAELKETNLEENQLLECFEELDDFPYSKGSGDGDPEEDEERKQFIYGLLLKLSRNPNMVLDVKMPKIDHQLFEKMTKEDIKKTREIYAKQLPVFWHQGMATDSNLIYVLAIGHHNHFEYLCHLADDFARQRVQNLARWKEKNEQSIKDGGDPVPLKPFTLQKYCSPQNHKHFKMLENVKVKVLELEESKGAKGKGGPVGYHELAKGALSSFFGRIMPKVMFTPMTSINNSIEVTVLYINQATIFVQNLIKEAEVCPFQLDLVIATGKPEQKIEDEPDDLDDESDDDDDEKGDEAGKYQDYVGDIKGKLEKNKLQYAMAKVQPTGRVFDDLYKAFKEKNKVEDTSKQAYLLKKRMIAMVDRRHQAEKTGGTADDDVYIYDSPKCAQHIPDNALPEWYIGASKMVLLPDMEFGKGPEYPPKVDNKASSPKGDAKDPSTHKTIGGSFSAAGSVLTLSIHAKQERVIKMYLFCNGQCIRFMPEDIKTVFPVLFNMDYANNRDFIEGNSKSDANDDAKKDANLFSVDQIIDSMKERIVDEEFDAFQQSYL